MPADLLIRGGTVVDGTGFPGYRADVEVRDGRISRIGRISERAVRTIDADGLVVSPGFIDIHTHYEAQLQFEPTASPSSWHGVTTVMTGNCGFTLAPSRPEDMSWLIHMLSRVEGMPLEALLASVTFGGGSVASLLAGFDGNLGINMAVFAGHCSIRRAVMGEAASERTATPEEIAAMAALLRQAMHDGAIGFSTSQLDIHADHNGRPVPSNLADHDELIGLAAVLGEFDQGMLEFLPRSGSEGYSAADRQVMLGMCAASAKPMNVNPLTRFLNAPDAWRHSLAFCEEAARMGYRIHPMVTVNPKGIHFALENTFMFDEMATFRHVLSRPLGERMAALRDPSVRAAMHQEYEGASRAFVFSWDQVRVAAAARPDHAAWEGQAVSALAATDGVDPLDWVIDSSLQEGLETVFALERPTDPLVTETTNALIRNPLTMAGSSDGGAHLQTFCGADYTTRFLTEPVPEVLSLEQAVSRLTLQPAVLHGLWDRGMLRPGAVADILTFDPGALAVTPVRFVRDFPTGASRLVFGSEGYHTTVVNGEVLLEEGAHTGALPGVVIRGNGAHAA